MLQIRQLAFPRSPWLLCRNLRFLYGNSLILLGAKPRAIACHSPKSRKVYMPTPRTRSISTKVTEEEYAHFEALAGAQTISEWAREVLLRASEPSPADQTIVAELLALRMILLNVLFSTANHESLDSEDMQDIINRADTCKLAKALERLATTTTGPQAG